jgi:hypothetical protein
MAVREDGVRKRCVLVKLWLQRGGLEKKGHDRVVMVGKRAELEVMGGRAAWN